METKLDSRQGQFPASFPDTFKDFFAMMNEDEDHLDLFSNLLEDKVIPRTNKFNQRRCGGSLRCTNNSSHSAGLGGGGSLNVGRSNSFRVNRPNNSVSTNSNFCKHVRYCCLHQQKQHYSQNFLDYSHGHVCRRAAGECCVDVGDSRNDESSTNNCEGSGGLQNAKNPRRAIMERSFEFDSCDESDTISTTSSTPTIPYSALSRHPLSQQQQQQHQQSHQLPMKKLHPQQQQQQQQQQQSKEHYSHHHQSQHNQSKGYHPKESNTTLPRIGLRGLDNSTCNTLGSGPNINNCNSSVSLPGHNNGGIINNGIASNSISISNNNSHCATAPTGGGGGGSGSGSRPLSNVFMDLNSPTERLSTSNMLSSGSGNPANRAGNIRALKSPILNRRRSSSIVSNLLTADIGGYRNTDETISRNHSTIPHSNTRERISHVKSPVNVKGKISSSMAVESSGGVLTFKQAMSGAVSPQYTATSPLQMMGGGIGGVSGVGNGSNNAMTSVLEATTDGSISPSPSANVIRGDRGDSGGGIFFCGSSATIAQLGCKQKQRLRTSSMPAESRKPRLADTRRAAIHCADLDLEYYRLRSFSITSHGVCNLGDSLRSRRSRSINSVTSTGTSNSGKDRNNSNASRTSGDIILEQDKKDIQGKSQIPAYKIAMLGASGVGKTALTYQFTTSDYICAYDLSLDEDYGQKTVSVLVDGIETDLEIIDHPACEMSTEAFCSTYNIDLFVVVYSVVDRPSFKTAEKVLHYLKESEMLLTRGAILVGNKTDLERHREVTRQNGRKLAKEVACKFIETSSGLDHNVDELLVGVVAQVKLNPKRILNLSEKDRQRLNLQTAIQKHRRMHIQPRKMVRQISMCQQEPDENSSTPANRNKLGPVRKTNKRTLNLESILKMGESEIEDEDEACRLKTNLRNNQDQFKSMTIGKGNSGDNMGPSSCNSSPKSRNSSYESSSLSGGGGCGSGGRKDSCHVEASLLDDCNKKAVSKLTNRTKIFLSSVLKFKKAINVKRRSSSSCSDLFVI
ncbi:uncharacterized protein DDB_G0283357 isoform X2 [Episyrphus balteatus]|nr:uncharacterized protein DDB_G0283357 isoform X2 [Episyrphus balteatus]